MGWPPVLCEAATGGSRSAPAPSQLQPFPLKPALPHVLSVEIVDRCAGPDGRAVTVVTGSLAGDNLPSLGARTLRAMSKPFTLTTSAGIPVIDGDNSRRAGRRGPLLTDHQLFGKLAHFNRGRVPEHGAGGRP